MPLTACPKVRLVLDGVYEQSLIDGAEFAF